MTYSLNNLDALESEAIHIIREVIAEFENPVLLYSIGKDSMCMLHVARKAFAPGPVPFPLLHIDTTWNFQDMITFRDRYCREHGLRLIVHVNEKAIAAGMNPFDYPSSVYTPTMNTHALIEALTLHRFDAALGGGRRDEEKSRAKERVFSFRDANHQWNPKNQRLSLHATGCRGRWRARSATSAGTATNAMLMALFSQSLVGLSAENIPVLGESASP